MFAFLVEVYVLRRIDRWTWVQTHKKNETRMFNVIGSALDTKTTTETGDNGRIITSTHRNPWVSGAAVLGVSAILVMVGAGW